MPTFKTQKAPIIKNACFEIKSIDKSDASNTAKIVGLSAGLGNKDSYNDIIKPGAFVKTLKENPNWPVLRFHDPDRKIGFSSEGKETLKGLQTTSIISLDTQDGREQFALSKLAFEIPKAKDAQSIGFNVPVGGSKTEKVDGEVVNFLTDINMWEHSFVTWGANEIAESSGFKSWLSKESDGFGLGEHVDEFFKFMESLGHDITEVKSIMLHEENEKNGNAELVQLMKETANIFKS